MQTTFTYNNVLVKNVYTEIIALDSDKDSTGVDQVGIRGQAVFTGVVQATQKWSVGDKAVASATATDHTGVAIPTFAGGLWDLLQKLSKDRRQFVLQMGRNTIFSVSPGAIDSNVTAQVTLQLDKMDIANGPKVSVQVIKITGGVAAHIRFTINFTIPNCGDNRKGGPSGLVNFRFWIHEGVDCKTWLTSRTYMGKIRVAHKNVSPHALAAVTTIPTVERGFKREVLSWEESPDGLHLDFTIRDQEMYVSPPYNAFSKVGAIDWSGQLTLRTGKTFGYSGYYDLALRLTGPKTTPKTALIEIAFLVAQQKCQFFDALKVASTPDSVTVLESLQITERFEENTVDVACSVRYSSGISAVTGLLAKGNDVLLGKPLNLASIGYDSEVAFYPGQSAGIGGIFLSLLQTPCAPASYPAASVQSMQRKRNTRTVAGKQEQDPSYYQSGKIQSGSSSDNLEGMYFEYLLDSEIVINNGRISLPTGAAADSNADTLAVVNLYRETAHRMINIDATRLNVHPTLPAWSLKFADENNIIHTPIGKGIISAQTPQVSADSRKLICRAQMHLKYALSRAPELGESLPMGCVPYRASGLQDPSRYLQPETFVQPSKLLG